MQIRTRWGFMAVLALSVTVGCSQSRQTIRGQSPSVVANPASMTNGFQAESNSAYGPIIGTAPGYGEQLSTSKAKHLKHDFKPSVGFRNDNFGYDGGFYAGPEGYYTEHDRTYTTNPEMAQGSAGGCPQCNYGQACPAEGCPHCGHHIAKILGHGPNGFPYHYQTYGYRWPQNEVYPAGPVPSGMIQYPYYTLRGPTDFFMK